MQQCGEEELFNFAALHSATLKGSTEAVKLLIEESDVVPRTVNKKSAFLIAHTL